MDVPIQQTRAKTLRVHLRIRRGRVARQLLTIGDTLTFDIYDVDTVNSLLRRSTNAGISQTDDGFATLTVEPTSWGYSVFPADAYRYEFQIIAGDTGEVDLLQAGDFTLLDSPNA